MLNNLSSFQVKETNNSFILQNVGLYLWYILYVQRNDAVGMQNTEFSLYKGNRLYRFYFLTTNLNISIEIFKYELLQVKYLFLQSQETAKQKSQIMEEEELQERFLKLFLIDNISFQLFCRYSIILFCKYRITQQDILCSSIQHYAMV